MGEKRNACKVLAGGTEEKRPLGRPRNREDDNIKINQTIIEWGRLYYVYLALELGQMSGFYDCGHEIFAFYQIREIFRPVKDVLPLQEGLCSVHVVKVKWKMISFICTN